jgi:predicted anti-sigma-YlaC factor YlaD
VTHVTPENLQQYLAGEAGLAEAAEIEEHLAACPLCSDQLAVIAAEDATLTGLLALDPEELAWIESMDLTRTVLERVTPWFRQPTAVAIAVMLLAAGGWLSQQMLSLLSRLVGVEGSVGLAVDLARSFGPLLVRLAFYLENGGLLASLWPALAIAGALWLWRRHPKEEKDYA